MVPAGSIADTVIRGMRSLFETISGGCSSLPCVIQQTPEHMELINADASSVEDDAPDFDYIRLLSYNIFIRMELFRLLSRFVGPPAPKFTHNVENDFKDQRLRCFMEHYLNKFDVICLQEMFGAFSRRRKKLIRLAYRKGFLWKVSSPQSRSSMFLVDGGCLILSRVKIVAQGSTIFAPGTMSDRLAAKGVIYAKLNPKPGVYIHLFVTHLQAVYADPESSTECLTIQRRQYDELVEFVASTVAANETANDMVEAQQLRDKRRQRIAELGTRSKHTGNPREGSITPPEQDTMFVSRKCRRWPIVIAGDFNCNSRPVPGDVITKVTKPYADLTSALHKIGPFSDVLLDGLGEHPVTYAAANFDLDGSFSPRETALTTPDDYNSSGEYVNQSLDYIFLFPPTHEEVRHNLQAPTLEPDGQMSPDSRAIRGSILRPTEVSVDHLKYVAPASTETRASSRKLQYLSDHFAVQSVLKVLSE
jgi:endonuclease/exonuclease/phosphatase family metal-dependent hydrolase